MKKMVASIGGLAAGILNGLLGAGGGMVIVPSLLHSGLEPKKAHANSVCIILPICIVSAIMYLLSNRVLVSDALPYIAWGVPGSLIGTWILQKIKPNILGKIFGALMIWAAFRMVFK